MARLVVIASHQVPSQIVAQQVAERVEADGHDVEVIPLTNLEEDLRVADGVIVVWDAHHAENGLAIGLAMAYERPTLVLADEDVPAWVSEHVTRIVKGASVDAWLEQLNSFYAEAQPFSGKLVRDLVPQLVRESGYELTFRALREDERAYFLKQKLLAEAKDLAAAERGPELESIADVLEVMEALIRERGYDRDNLRQVKEGKRKRRGGFERCFVVESDASSRKATDAAAEPEQDPEILARKSDIIEA